MTESGLKAKFARLGPTQAPAPAPSGSREQMTIRRGVDLHAIDTINAVLLLHHSGLTLLRAKRTIETVMDGTAVSVDLTHVADAAAFAREMLESGFEAVVRPREVPDIHALRERFGLTQEQFAARFGLEVDAVRNWEHGRRMPDTAARSLLRVIAKFPKEVAEALEG
jgi:putative transcriptional regulator